MGFGTLLIGFLFLVNITQYSPLTDPFAALLLFSGLLKLAKWNKPLRIGQDITGVFAILTLARLALFLVAFFAPGTIGEGVLFTLAAARDILLAGSLASTLFGIRSLGVEVGDLTLAARATVAAIFLGLTLLVLAVAEIPALLSPLGEIAPGYIAAVALLFFFALWVFTAFAVLYRAYARICMPEDTVAPLESLPMNDRNDK